MNLRPSVDNEWGTLRAAMVYPGINDVLRCRNLRSPAQGEKGLGDVLRDYGVELVVPDMPPERAKKATFARDPITVIGETIHTCDMNGPRRGEVNFVIAAMEKLGLQTTRWGEHGGDTILIGGNKVLLGYSSSRDDTTEPYDDIRPWNADKLEAQIAALGMKVHLLCHEAMHLDCAIAPLPDGEILANKESLWPQGILDLEAINNRIHWMKEQRRLEFNLLWLNPSTVLSPGGACFPVQQHLQEKGYDVWQVSGEAEKAGGSARCAVAALVRDSHDL